MQVRRGEFYRSARVLACVLACLASGLRSAHGGFLLPVKRRDGGLHSRDLLQNATIPLHGAVRDYGYFYATLQLGTPAKSFEVIVDTGSTITYVPCAQCGDQCGSHHADAAFDPAGSSTSVEIFCGDPRCLCGSPACSCAAQGQCSYVRNYAEQSSSSGNLIQDELQLLGGTSPVVFGCETLETGEIFSQEADGIMGLGNSEVSVINQLAGAGAIEDVFSLCFGGVEGNGALMLGDVPPATFNVDLQYTPLVFSAVHPHYYLAHLQNIAVGGTILPVDQGLYDIGYGTVLDSGTTFTYLPSQAYDQFHQHVSDFALSHGLQTIPGPDPRYPDSCFGGAPDASHPDQLKEFFPTVDLYFEGTTFSIPPLNYLFMHTRESNAFCIGVFNNGGSGTLLGGITFRDTLIQYDRRNNRVGFGAAPCQEIGTGELVLDPCDPSLIEEARAMLPACESTAVPIPVTTLVEPSPSPGSRPGQEDDVLESEVSNNGSSGSVHTAAAIFSRGAAKGAAAVGGMLVIVCAVALVVRRTNLVTSLKDRWQAQPYEAVGDTGKATAAGGISLSDVRIDNEAVSDAASSTRSRSPGRTLA